MLILLIWMPMPSSAKHFKVLDISDGLSNNTVKCITQDKQGFIWMGTFDGLCKFDGVSFTVYRHDPEYSLSLANNHVEALLPVEDGMWIGTENGLNYFSSKENRFYPCFKMYPTGETVKMDKAVKSIIAVGSRLFVLSASRKLFVLKEDRTFEQCSYDKEVAWYAIAACRDGLLLAHSNKGFYLIDPAKGKVISRLEQKVNASNDNILYYSKNRNIVYVGLGIGYPGRAFTISDKQEIKELDQDVPSDVKSIIDYKDKTFFGTDGKGLVGLWKDKTFKFTPKNSTISSDAVHALFVDRDENLWIGTYRGGVNIYSARYNWFKSLTIADKQLTYKVATAVYSTMDKIYVGLDGGGLDIYDTKTGNVSDHTIANSDIAGNNVLSVCGDGQYVWLGIYGKGLCRFSPSTHSFRTYVLPPLDGEPNKNRIWQIKDDGRGYIWVIGEDVYLFNKSAETFTVVGELKDINASSIVFDGNISWLSSTSSGLYKLDRVTGKILKHYFRDAEEMPLASNIIRYLFVDSKHKVWFSTEFSGFYQLNEEAGTIIPYGLKNGLTERNVVSMQEDLSGYLWLGTNNGLFRYDPNSSTFIRFGKQDNLSLMQFNYNASFQRDHILYFGTTEGVVYFNPAEIKYQPHSNTVYFSKFELLKDNKEVINLYGDKPDEIRLSYDQNFFTITFSTPELTSSDKVHFACYMKNFEEDWQEVMHNRQVSYTNVPPGEYLFYVRCSDSNGKWKENASCLRIVITPPWWNTVWAWCLWIVMAGGILFLFFRFYRHELNIKHIVQLNEMEKNATKTISEAKLNFFTNITHELRTPIFLITAPLEELLSGGKGPVQVPKSYLTAMYRNAVRLNKLISRIIDFRKLESGKLKLEIQRLNVVAFCKDLTVDYEALCQQKNILFYFQPSRTVIQLDFDSEKLETILTNLVSNAFKYTPEGGKIIFSITETENEVEFTVEDNGIGIKKEYHEVIFDSFFQVDPSKASAMGDGIGLSFVKHLVELHGGVVRMESEPEHGSKFVFCIPRVETEKPETMENSSIIVDEKIEQVPEQAAVSVQSPAAIRSVLIIDDEKETIEILERFLIEDFKIWKAGNGVDGLAIAQESLPDIIICDVMMPKMDGTEFLTIVKSDKKLAHIPVIMFTAKTSEEDKMAAFDCGADAYLTKPVSLKYLRKRMDHLLARSESVEVTRMISKTEKNYTKEEQRFLLKCREIIEDNLTNPGFDVVFFAGELGMSHSTLYRKVKAVTGMSAIEFINEYRVFRAIQYFKEGETNITAVSVKCGFNELKNFRDAFKKKMEMTPKQYVQQL